LTARQAHSDCLFCRILHGDETAEIVLDEPHAAAFLDFRPVFPGHCLLVPRDHHETLADLPAQAIGPLFATTQRLARAVEVAMEADGTFVAMNNKVSQSVPHLHVHVVPRKRKDGLRGFFWPRQKYAGPGQMQEVADRLRAALAVT
jgi:histidine triad (HIT) family protein